MEELIAELRGYAKHAQWQAPRKAADALEAQQARIAELREAIKAMADDGWLYHGSEGMSEAQEKCYAVYISTDDMNAIAAHDAAVKKAALLEAAEKFDSWNGGPINRELRRMAEGNRNEF